MYAGVIAMLKGWPCLTGETAHAFLEISERCLDFYSHTVATLSRIATYVSNHSR